MNCPSLQRLATGPRFGQGRRTPCARIAGGPTPIALRIPFEAWVAPRAPWKH